MARPSYLLFLASLYFSVVFLYPLSCQGAEHPVFFIFGDSLYDNGNNIFITPDQPSPPYFLPFGKTYFGYATGRQSDGRIVADFIAAKLNLPFMPPILDPEGNFTYGANLASAGGGIFTDYDHKAMNFTTQIDEYKKLVIRWEIELGPDEAQRRLNNAVHLIAIGGDDYFNFMYDSRNATVPEQQAYVDTWLGNFTTMVKEIYNYGGRKFMIQNLPPLGCLPFVKEHYFLSGDITSNLCAGKPTTLSMLHNDSLHTVMREMSVELDGSFIYSIFNYYTAIGDRIDNPTAYGFKEGDVGCCGVGSRRGDGCGSPNSPEFELCYDPNDYVFFDGGHNTDRANSQLADLMWSGGPEFVYPFTMQQLFDVLIPTLNYASSSKNSCSLSEK